MPFVLKPPSANVVLGQSYREGWGGRESLDNRRSSFQGLPRTGSGGRFSAKSMGCCVVCSRSRRLEGGLIGDCVRIQYMSMYIVGEVMYDINVP